ncbi:MAG: pyrimidine/purine nucleoside phosphorylase [bacterium]|nr:pyrimidine/purine nucleoside phosphorylase [bacterium]
MAQDTFDNISIIKKANIYYDGQVTSRTINFPDGSHKTLGIMMPGEYEFGTEAQELMEVLGGEMKILLPGSNDWEVFAEGQSFTVPANSSFKLILSSVADYCCTYQ